MDNQNSFKKEIVIVDDNYVIREVLKNVIQHYKKDFFKIFTSFNGLEGLGLISITKPDLIILDSTLPKYAGLELFEFIQSNQTLVNQKTSLILIHEDDNIPEISYPHCILLNKRDPNFINKLKDSINQTFFAASDSSVKSTKKKLIEFFSSKAISLSNSSDLLLHRIYKDNIILKSAKYLFWILIQILISFTLTAFYLLIGRRHDDENIAQSKQDYFNFRVRFYPTLVTFLVGSMILLLQLAAFVVAGVAVLSSQITKILAEQVCPLPAAPTVINNQVSITPDGVDGVINCSAVDIIIGSTGEVIMERNATLNSSTADDRGVTLLVRNLTVQSGGKINADRQGYRVRELDSGAGQGGSAYGQTGGSGGGYGGAGGQGQEDGVHPAGLGGTAYGSSEAPISLGSAGGVGGLASTISKTWTSSADFNASGTSFSSGLENPAVNNEIKLKKTVTNYTTSGLMGYWNVNEASGTSISDVTGSTADLNIAQGTSVSVSSSYVYYSCGGGGNVVDGNVDTCFAPDGYYGGYYRGGEWFQIDLGSVKSFYRLEWVSTPGGNSIPIDYNIQISSDGSNWTTPVTITGNNQATRTHDLGGTLSARYIKMTVTSVVYPTFAVSEFRAFQQVDWNATATNTTVVAGKVGNARSFGGSGYITLNRTDSLNPTSGISISFWVKPDSSSFAVLADNMTNSPYRGWEVYKDTSNRIVWEFLTSNGYYSLTSNTGMTLGQWYHIAVTYDGSNSYIYINGAQDNTRSASGTISYGSGMVPTFGARVAGSDYKLNGSMDEIAVYNRGITVQEAQTNYLYNTANETGEQTWTSDTIDAGADNAYQMNRFTANWTLDGTDNIAPKFQFLASSSGDFGGEEAIFPNGAGSYYVDGGTYSITSGSELDISPEVGAAYRYWKVVAVIDTGSDTSDTPIVSDITIKAVSDSTLTDGGSGGGAIKIVSTGTVTVDGTISADGETSSGNGATSGGGGSGGSVWIEAISFAGSGSVHANGGGSAAATYRGGGGGGGRIVMLASTSSTFTGTASVAGGTVTGAQNGGVGTLIGPTTRPTAPTIVKQYKSNETTEILVNGVATGTTVVFGSNMIDPDASDTLALQVEVRPVGTAFTGVPTNTQASNSPNPSGCSTPLTNCGKVTVTGLTASTEYHWQARVRDNHGGVSTWVSFGENAESARDVLVPGTAATISLISGNNQSGTVYTNLANPFIVKITDSNGLPVPGYSISWSAVNAANGGAMQGDATTTSGDDGQSSNTYKLGRTAGANAVSATASGLTGSPISFSATGTPDALEHFGFSVPQVVLIDQNFDPAVVVTAYDQYNNVKTDYTGTVTFTPVDPLNVSSQRSGTLTPGSYTFIGGDAGAKSIANFQYDTAESIRIKVVAGGITSYSSSVAVVSSIGACPDADGIIDSNQTWTADTNNHGIFDCRGYTITVTNNAVLTLQSYDSGDTNYTNDFGATIWADNVVVSAGSTITADSYGYVAGRGPGGNSSGGGAGYGGDGGTGWGAGSAYYGSVYEPSDLGSGSNATGGGSIKLTITGNLTLNGTITTKGTDAGTCQGGGGSGGSIWIDTLKIGGTGSLGADGGRGNCNGGGGSGGRIAVYYTNNGFDAIPAIDLSLKTKAHAFGSDSSWGNGYYGAAGTIYTEQRGADTNHAGKLYIDNNNFNGAFAGLSESAYQFSKVQLKEYGHLRVYGNNSTLTITSGSDLIGDSTKSTLQVDGTFVSPGTLALDGISLNIKGEINLGGNNTSSNLTIGGTLGGGLILNAYTWAHNNTNQYTLGTILVKSNGTLTLTSYDNADTDYTNDYGLSLTTTNLEVEDGGSITANGLGYATNRGPGGWGYAAHGGYTYGSTGTPNGSVYEPTNLGSAGSTYGGGAIKLTVSNNLTLNGTISSTGTAGWACHQAGGAGGSIWIDANNIGGSGIINTDGAMGACGGQGGSGGRIAIYYTTNGFGSAPAIDFSSNAKVHAFGKWSQWGGLEAGAGTIYVEQKGVDTNHAAKLYVNNNGLTLTTPAALVQGDYQLSLIRLTNSGSLRLIGNSSNLTISNGSNLLGDSSKPILTVDGTFHAPSTLTINGVTVNINGEIDLGGNNASSSITVGGTNAAGLALNANTWAHNSTTQYTLGNILVKNNGTLALASYDNADANYTNDYGLTLNATNLEVETSGIVSADGLGYSSARGIGGGYGSHGGYAGGNNGTPNGDLYQPTALGSAATGSGGGAIKLVISSNFTLNGTITSAGGGGWACHQWGGAGGSIWIDANNIGGTGIISADGGMGYCGGGGGSGGRIAIYYTTNGFNSVPSIDLSSNTKVHAFGKWSAWGGVEAGAGTIYVEQKGVDTNHAGKLYVNNNGLTLATPAALTQGDYQLSLIRLTNSGSLRVIGNSSNLTISNGNNLTGDSSKPNLVVDGTFHAPSTLSISGVTLYVNGEIDLGGNNATSNLTVGGSNAGGLTLNANTWAHNSTNTYTLGTITVLANGVITLNSYNDNDTNYTNDYGLTLNATNIDIQSGGNINADGNGYYGTNGPGVGAAGGGGAYGGYGGNGWDIGGSPYGSVYQPASLGSGNYYSSVASYGGGAMKLGISNNLTLNGTITSNGQYIDYCHIGGGSGGSIWIDTNNIGGAGSIAADGARGGCSGGNGSGGRIAVYYTANGFGAVPSIDLSLPAKAHAFSSSLGSYPGAPGTVYVEHKNVDLSHQGNLYVNNNGLNYGSAGLPEDTYVFNLIKLTSYGHLRVLGANSSLAISNGSNLTGDNTKPNLQVDGTFVGPSSLTIDGVTVNINGEINLNNDNPNSSITVGGTNAGGLTLNASTWAHNKTTPYTLGNITVTSNGTILLVPYQNGNTTYTDDYGVTLNTSNIDLQTGGSINSDFLGYTGYNGPGTGNGGGGAGHGGYGGIGVVAGGIFYGDLKQPTDFGSGSYYSGASVGGGAFKLNVTGDFTLNGTVSATGQSYVGSCHLGGGSGGSVWIDAVRIGGTGTVSADGGIGGCGGGGGAGGRIAIYYTTNGFNSVPETDFTATSRVHAFGNYSQGGGTYAGPGTIYYEHKSSDIVNQGSLFIHNNAHAGQGQDFIAGNYYFNNVKIGTNITLAMEGDTSSTSGQGVIFNLAGNFYLDENSFLDGRLQGFVTSAGPGKGADGAGQSGGGGGAYGGGGGAGQSDGGNPAPSGGVAYGSQREPLALGSGGGKSGPGTVGGKGGGAVAVRARSGDITMITGSKIDVSGEVGHVASPGGGGGSGGSILIEGNTCALDGSLLSNGGNGGDESFDGGGGGGGRISILSSGGTCNVGGTVAASQGTSSGAQAGQVGTNPAVSTIPATPTVKEQYKSDGATAIPVGGYTPEQVVKLKANISDPGASVGNPKDLAAEFEVVGANQSFTGAEIIRGNIIPDPRATQFAGIYNVPSVTYTGGTPLIGLTTVTGLTPGASYKWRARVVNTADGISGSWVDYGSNSSTQADFIVSNTASLSISVNHTNVNVGDPISITVSAKDNSNNTDATYTGTVHFTSTGSANLPSNYIFGGADAGTHTFTNQLVFNQAGTYTVTVTDTLAGSLTATSASITVTTYMNSLTISPSKTNPVVGELINLTVTAKDNFNNTYAPYAGTVTFGSTSGSATVPANYTFNGSEGTHSFNNSVKFTTPGTFTVTVTDISNGSLTATTASITVGASTTSLTAAPVTTNVEAGTPVSITIEAKNAQNTNDPYYTGTIHFTSTDGGATLPADYTFTQSDNGSHTFTNGIIFSTAGSYTVSISDSQNALLTVVSSGFSVSSNTPSNTTTDLTSIPAKTTVKAGEPFSITVQALNTDNNPDSNYNGTVVFSSSDPYAVLPNNYHYTTDDNGSHTFTNEFKFIHAGTYTITAKDAVTQTLIATVTINVERVAASFIVQTNKTTTNLGEFLTLTVIAVDANGIKDPNFVGTVKFASTGENTMLPSVYTFTQSDGGVKIFTSAIKFTTEGSFTITAEDTIDSSIKGTSESIVVGENTQAGTQISTPTSRVIDSNTIEVCYSTNVTTVGSIQYGKSDFAIYTKTTDIESVYKTEHCFTISNLDSTGVYLYQITATSASGNTNTYQGQFSVSGESVMTAGGNVCVNNANNYAFNSNHEAILTYNTEEDSLCTVYYGNSTSNLPYSSIDSVKSKSHQAILDLLKLDGQNDLFYRIECGVKVNGEELMCKSNNVIPVSKYGVYYPYPENLTASFLQNLAKGLVPAVLSIATLSILALNVIAFPQFFAVGLPWIVRKKRKIWGIVYDKESKEPIPFVTVRLFGSDGNFLQQQVTNFEGKYGFIVDKGRYKVEAVHMDYNTNSINVEISKLEGFIGKDIELTKRRVAGSDFGATLKKLRLKVKNNIYTINRIIVTAGFIFSTGAFIVTPIAFNLFVLFAYIIQMLFVYVFGYQQRGWGFVYDVDDKSRIKGAVVRVFDPLEKRQVDIQLTDQHGRFGFRLPEQKYSLLVHSAGFKLSQKLKHLKITETATGENFIHTNLKTDKGLDLEIPLKKHEVSSKKLHTGGFLS